MPKFIIKILRRVEVFEKVEEREIEAPTINFAKREAGFILGEEFPADPNIEADIKEKKEPPF